MLRSCFLSSFVEFRSAIPEEKSKKPQPIRGLDGHFISSPERKAQVSYCHSASSVCPSSGVNFHMFDFPESAEQNSTKLDRRQDRNVLYHVCVFSGRSAKQDGRPGLWLTETFFDFSETNERNSTKLDRNQDPNVLYQACVFGPIGKTRWPPWSLIGWYIFDFFSESA